MCCKAMWSNTIDDGTPASVNRNLLYGTYLVPMHLQRWSLSIAVRVNPGAMQKTSVYCRNLNIELWLDKEMTLYFTVNALNGFSKYIPHH